jgi:hypothetical protein
MAELDLAGDEADQCGDRSAVRIALSGHVVDDGTEDRTVREAIHGRVEECPEISITVKSSYPWAIMRLTYVTSEVQDVEWAQGTNHFTNVWDSRAGYAYS